MSDIKMAPSCKESEMGILSAIMRENDKIHDAMSKVEPNDFLSRQCRVLYTTMLSLIKKDKRIDMLTMCDSLKNNSTLEDIGGVDFLSLVEGFVPTSQALGHHCNRVRTLSLQRKFIDEMGGYVNKAYDMSEDPSSLLEEAYGSVFDMINQSDSKSDRKDVYTPKDMAERGFLDAKDRLENPELHSGLRTGIPNLDKHIKSLKDLNVIAASTGVGKTGLAMNIAINLALRKTPVLYINLEMDIDQMLCRILSNLSGVTIDEIETGKYNSDSRFADVASIASKLEHSKLYMTHNKPKNISKIISLINKYSNKYGIEVVIIDYIGHIESDKLSYKENNRRISLGRYNQAIKNACTKLGIKAIVVAQLNRDGDKDPDLVNVGECWQLAQDADIFMILHYEMAKNSDPSGPPEFERYYVKLAKNRNGPAPRTVHINYDKTTQLITEADENGLRKGSSQSVGLKGMQALKTASTLFDGDNS